MFVLLQQNIINEFLPPYNDLNVFLCLTSSFKTIIQYIDNQFERYLHDESGLNRRHIVDNRVHCCFYFISPFGHGWVYRRQYRAEGDDTSIFALLTFSSGIVES